MSDGEKTSLCLIDDDHKVDSLSATNFGDRMILGIWSCSEIGDKMISFTSLRGEARA